MTDGRVQSGSVYPDKINMRLIYLDKVYLYKRIRRNFVIARHRCETTGERALWSLNGHKNSVKFPFVRHFVVVAHEPLSFVDAISIFRPSLGCRLISRVLGHILPTNYRISFCVFFRGLFGTFSSFNVDFQTSLRLPEGPNTHFTFCQRPNFDQTLFRHGKQSGFDSNVLRFVQIGRVEIVLKSYGQN